MVTSLRDRCQLVKELAEAGPTASGIRGTHRYHLYLKGVNPTTGPGLAHRIPLQQAQESEALEAAEIETGRSGPRALRPRQEHVRPQLLVAGLGSATHQ